VDDGTVAAVLLEGEYSVVLELGFEYWVRGGIVVGVLRWGELRRCRVD